MACEGQEEAQHRCQLWLPWVRSLCSPMPACIWGQVCPQVKQPPGHSSQGSSPTSFTASGKDGSFLLLWLWVVRNLILAEPLPLLPTPVFIPLVQRTTRVTTWAPFSRESVTRAPLPRWGQRLQGRLCAPSPQHATTCHSS